MKNKIIILLSLIILNQHIFGSETCPSGESKEAKAAEEKKPEIQLEQKGKIVQILNEKDSGFIIEVKILQDKPYIFDVYEGELKLLTNFDYKIQLRPFKKCFSRNSPTSLYIIDKNGFIEEPRQKIRGNVLGKTLIIDKTTGSKFKIK